MNLAILLTLIKSSLPISRPRFWIYLLGPFLIGLIASQAQITTTSLLSLFGGFSAAPGPVNLFGFLLYFTYPANLLVYGVNDIFDYETDKLNEKKVGYEELVAPESRLQLRMLIAITNLPFLLLTILPNPESYYWLAIFAASAVFYSAPPLRAKTKPILDTIVSAFVYIAPGYVGYYISGGNGFDWFIFFALLARNMAMHAYSAIPDIQADTEAEIKTVATLYGKTGTLIFCIVCYLLAIILSFPSLGRFSPIVGSVYLIMMILSFKSSPVITNTSSIITSTQIHDNESNHITDVLPPIPTLDSHVFRLYKLFPWINMTVGGILFFYIWFFLR